MSSAQYQALPTSPSEFDEDVDERPRHPIPEELQLAQDPRFNPPAPPAWKRIALLIFIAVMFWLSFHLRSPKTSLVEEPAQVVHAQRYSKAHKYRPAASPIITEQLKDGRVRLRGAQPTVRS